MDFELSADQESARAAARAFASTRLAAVAQDIDRTAAVPPEIAREAAGLVEGAADALAMALAVEEIASASGAVAVAAVNPVAPAERADLAGLRGAPVPPDSPRGQLALAAVALGLGRAALDEALTEIRRATAQPQADTEKPHWVVADAATELEAARLMTRSAAQAIDEGTGEIEVALARLMATAAAQTVVDAALRVVGAGAYRDGMLLERLSRDVRAISVLLGTEERQRATAATGLLPD